MSQTHTHTHPYANHMYRLRKNRGYGQKTLARLIGRRSARTISQYETGAVLPPLKTALLLEIALGARLSEIYVDLYRSLEVAAMTREARLPTSLGRHIRGRVTGEDAV